MQLFIVLCLICIPALSYSQETVAFDCVYRTYCDDTGHNLKTKGNEFRFQFLYDMKTDKGYMIGEIGATGVQVIAGTSEPGLTFIEQTKAGNVLVTTINLKDLSSVHSRHPLIGGILAASQYRGKCSMK